ncbi:MAG TPA: hypothetical protein VK661_10015 [Planctomycetota bacterium]|nr:hypothetical protein [Planctomycetota bacterium]
MVRMAGLEAPVRRVVVLGGAGFFGSVAVDLLRAEGIEPVVASRRTGTDAEDRASLRLSLRAGDVVLDAAGPYQGRTITLIEAAIGLGFDVVDLSDSGAYASRVMAMKARIDAAGIRVLTSCSSVSSFTAAAVRMSGIAQPARVALFLVPSTRHTANRGVMHSLLANLGAPGAWRTSRMFPMPPPIGDVRGFRLPSADSVTLRPVWPSLREVGFFVTTRTPAGNALVGMAARIPALRRILPAARAMAKRFGAVTGGLGLEVDDARFAVMAEERSWRAAVAPAVLAVRAIVREKFPYRGFVTPERHVEPDELVNFLVKLGVTFRRIDTLTRAR